MPKIVDHEVRREEIVDAVWKLISREGMASATTRNIANAVGCSNGILSHYFADKAELLHAALHRGYRRVEEQIRESRSRARGLPALRDVLLLAVAITEDKLLGNKVELAYLGEAVGDAKLAREHYETYERYRAIVREVLVEARSAGEIARSVNVDTVADVLVAVVDGLGMEAALFPEAFRAKRQTAVIDNLLDGLRARRAAIPRRKRGHSGFSRGARSSGR